MRGTRAKAVWLAPCVRTEIPALMRRGQTTADVERRHCSRKNVDSAGKHAARLRSLVRHVSNLLQAHADEEKAMLLRWANAHAPVSTRRLAALQRAVAASAKRAAESAKIAELRANLAVLTKAQSAADAAAARARRKPTDDTLGARPEELTAWGEAEGEPVVPAASRAAVDASADEPATDDAEGDDAEEDEEAEEADADAAAKAALPKDKAAVEKYEEQLMTAMGKLERTEALRNTQYQAALEIERKLENAQKLMLERTPAPLRRTPGHGPPVCAKCRGRAPLPDCARSACSSECCSALKAAGGAGPSRCSKHKN